MSVLIFYGDLRKTDYIDGTWGLYTDTVCENCGKVHPLSNGGFCNRCGETTEYGFVEIQKIPLAFRNQESADLFEDQFNAFLVATELFGYEKRSVYNMAHGRNPKIGYHLTDNKEGKSIKIEFHVPQSTICGSAYGEVNRFSGKATYKEESSYITSESFIDFFNQINSLI
ncbi:hypothetical protein D3C87_79690 [compost metagenome]